MFAKDPEFVLEVPVLSVLARFEGLSSVSILHLFPSSILTAFEVSRDSFERWRLKGDFIFFSVTSLSNFFSFSLSLKAIFSSRGDFDVFPSKLSTIISGIDSWRRVLSIFSSWMFRKSNSPVNWNHRSQNLRNPAIPPSFCFVAVNKNTWGAAAEIICVDTNLFHRFKVKFSSDQLLCLCLVSRACWLQRF